MAAGCLEDPKKARVQATYFTADFLSSQLSHEAGRRFDSAPCASLVHASERNRSLRYLFGPTMDKAVNHQEYLESKTNSLLQSTIELSVEFCTPFPAGKVYAHLKSTLPAVDSSPKRCRGELTAVSDAYISAPPSFIDRGICAGPLQMFLFEVVCFKTASKSRKSVRLKTSSILGQIKKTGLLEQGRQLRRRQIAAAYLGKHHTQKTYSQRVLEDSEPRDGEEVYWLRLPEKSGPFYPGRFDDPQWTFALAIKFLTYAVPALLKSDDNRSRAEFFEHYLRNGGIIPGIRVDLMIQSSTESFPFFNHVFVQSQKYRFLEANSLVSLVSYKKARVWDDVISLLVPHVTKTPRVILGTRRALLQGNETVVCVFATIDAAPKCSMNLSSLQQLGMPFRISKKFTDEAAKREEALRQLSEMTELNGLEESFDLEERILSLASSK